MSVKFVKVTELRNRRQSCQKTTVTGLENMLPCQSLITENDSMELLSQVRSYMLLEMAPGETIHQSYECSPLLSLFCVKNNSNEDRFSLLKNLRPLMSEHFMLYCLNGEYVY